MATGSQTRTAGLCFLALIGALYLTILFRSENNYETARFQPLSGTAGASKFTIEPEFDANFLETHDQRIQHIQDTCSVPSWGREQSKYKQTYTFRTSSNNYFYPKFNLVYCKVPKVACTFMMEMFQTLQLGHTDSATIFATSRGKIHGKTSSNRIKNKTSDLPTVYASRNPYSRLYSAYVDKILLPNMYGISRNIQNAVNMKKGLEDDNNVCANDVTFQQFLDSIIRTAKSRGRMDLHWAPIGIICQPCVIDNYMLIKQETFTEDIEAFLKSINVTGSMYDNIKAIMTSKRIESTIPGIVQVVHDHARKIKDCLSDVQLLNKLWVSFQIQGYISEDRKFPSEKFNHMVDKESVAYFSDFMVREAKESNLTRTQSKAQRNDYLVRAYKDISFGTIEEIKKIYRSDFLLFDYSMTPPA